MFQRRLMCVVGALSPLLAMAAGPPADPSVPCQPGQVSCAPPELPAAGARLQGSPPPVRGMEASPRASPDGKARKPRESRQDCPAGMSRCKGAEPDDMMGGPQHQGRPGGGAAAGSGGGADPRPAR